MASLRPIPSPRPIPSLLAAIVLVFPFAFLSGRAQTSTPQHGSTGRLVLVLPFENHSGVQALSWIGDSFPDTLDARLSSAGFLTISHDDRQFALDHLGLPADFKPTRATTIRIAQNLDVDYVIFGNYTVRDGQIKVQAQVLAIDQLHLSPPLEDSAELARLFDVENAIAWKAAKQIDPQFKVAQQTFLAASGGVRLSAFESYIRGLDAPTPQERLKRLQVAVLDTPNYAAALLALGKVQYADRNYDQAAASLAKIPQTDRRALEANFYIGLARFNTAHYADAETAFTFVASRLPLPEVLNDEAVAQSRQNKDASSLFRRVSTADPGDSDYHFNLAVALARRGDTANALKEVDAALKLKPADSEAVELRALLANGKTLTSQSASLQKTSSPPNPSAPPTDKGFEPLERIRRTYSEASFRQAAFQMEQMLSLRLASLPPSAQATQYAKLGQEYLAQGLAPEAEQQFMAALTADPTTTSPTAAAAAHAGLGQVREQSGQAAEARTEASKSLSLQPNVDAYLVLARLDLQANNLPSAAASVSSALRIEPNNSAARGMRQALQSRGQQVP